MLILSSLIWVSGCSSTGGTNKAPDGALTLPMDSQERTEDDTPRTLLKKFEFNLKELNDGNNRFKSIRE